MCLYYLITFTNGTITYTSSYVVLWVHIYSTCLAQDTSKIRSGGHFFLRYFIKDIKKARPKINGPAHTLCKVLKNIVASAAECEIASEFENGQDVTVTWRALI